MIEITPTVEFDMNSCSVAAALVFESVLVDLRQPDELRKGTDEIDIVLELGSAEQKWPNVVSARMIENRIKVEGDMRLADL